MGRSSSTLDTVKVVGWRPSKTVAVWQFGPFPGNPRLGRIKVCVVVSLLLAGGVGLAQTGARFTFIGVSLDEPTRQADHRLTEYLSEKLGVGFAPDELEYEQVIHRLVDWRYQDGPFLARTTPYAYVVSELLGAQVEPLATYLSVATGRPTYHSYFVVNRQAFPAQPTLADLLRFVVERKERARFIFQSQFSTSSYFLPSLFFRSHRIFQMPESTGALTAMTSTKIADASSSTLVELVASGAADVAAVWDGTKAKYEPGGAGYAAAGGRVYFIELPTALPTDLLVCSSSLDPQIKNKLRQAIIAMRGDQIDVGDFRTWKDVNEAPEARQALADLRHVAREAVAPVTVEIQLEPRAGAAANPDMILEAARQAVRLSETEFVLYDQDFHRHVDFRWTLEPIHDGAVRLRSAIPGSDVEDQIFQLSFRDTEDLTARIVSLVQSRLHRVRYVWPFSAGAPIVIRNSAGALAPGTPVTVQRITWIDPERDEYRAGQVFTARIAGASFYRYELVQDDFARAVGADARLDPMSNSGFRVILVRPAREPLLFRVLTSALVALFVLAAASAAWSLFKKPSLRPVSSAAPGRRT